MRSLVIKSGLFLLAAALVADEASAQRQPRRRTNNPTVVDTSGRPINQVTNVNTQPGYDPYADLPITYDSIGMSDTAVRKSLRNDNAFDKSSLTARSPLPYEHLRWDDALYAEKVWRELDLREKMNQTFRYNAVDDNGSQLFINMLLKAVNSGEVTAFADDRFTTPMSTTDLSLITAGKVDTALKYDINDVTKVVGRVITRAAFDANSVVKLRIKEEWVFDREASRMFVRILGIAPLKTEYLPNGQERGSSVLFWVYYPDLRPMLAKAEVYNPKNMGQSRMTWEELFESRMFSSYIVKSTLDNPRMLNLRQLVDRRDPILALLEGENVKEKIFNYEQDLWSY
ncbi:MAG TPA: gliding motility protein GldN [Chitinophagaceae bacterium]|nr:gliding motility protein GldN [Chitinophagaceae bacterium]